MKKLLVIFTSCLLLFTGCSSKDEDITIKDSNEPVVEDENTISNAADFK